MTSIHPTGCVEFRFFRPHARDVRLAGDFNDWDGRALRMQPDDQGWWKALLTLKEGEYRFRYLADGNWYTDFAAHGVEPSRYGWNSILYVPPGKDGETTDMKTGPEVHSPR